MTLKSIKNIAFSKSNTKGFKRTLANQAPLFEIGILVTTPNNIFKQELKNICRYEICFVLVLKNVVFVTQPTFFCTKLTIETLEQGVKYVQS